MGTTGATIPNCNYFPFGDDLSSWGNQGTEYKYSGKELDEEGGFNLYYYRARVSDVGGKWTD